MSRGLQEALEEVYGGDQSLEASAVADKLADRNLAVVPAGFTYDLQIPRRRWWPVVVSVLLLLAVVVGMVASSEAGL